jgi:cell division protease FtsH
MKAPGKPLRVGRSPRKPAAGSDFNSPKRGGHADSAAKAISHRSPNLHPRKSIVKAAIESSMTPDLGMALQHPATLALVVTVPSTSWIKAVDEFFADGAFDRRWSRFARDGSLPREHVPSMGCDAVAFALSRGESVVGIASMPERVLPDTLMAAADFRIQITVNPTVLRTALRRSTAGAPPRSIPDAVTSLDFNDYVAAMRPGAAGAEVLSRLSSVSEHRLNRSRVVSAPDLETAVEFGAAREWGLALARDLDEYRAGRLPWSAIDRGAIFHSPPGFGKTLLAHSLARKCSAHLVVGSIGELFATTAGFLDSVIKGQRELFSRAAAAASSRRGALLFLDEIDALPSRESLKSSRGADWWLPVITDFLLLLDDATSGRREGIVVVAATNRIHAVDPAILRPGRLERAIEILPPDEAGILNMLRFHAPETKASDLEGVVERLIGCTAAEIMETVRAGRRTARQARRPLTAEDIAAAAIPSVPLSREALYRVGVHEAGHAVVAHALRAGRVGHIRIGGRGTWNAQTRVEFEESDLITREAIEQHTIVLLAGRAAEIEVLGAASTGGGGDAEQSDIGRATALLSAMHFSFGLAQDGIVHISPPHKAARELRRYPSVRRNVDAMLRVFQTRAIDIVRENREALVAVAKLVAERRFVSGSEIRAILDAAGKSGPKTRRGTSS